MTTIIFRSPTLAALFFVAVVWQPVFGLSGRCVTPSSKLHPTLAAAANVCSSQNVQPENGSTNSVSGFALDHRLTVRNDKLQVEIFLADTSATFLQRLNEFGIQQDDSFGRVGNVVQAYVPPDQLLKLVDEDAVRWIQPPGHPHVETVKEGVALTGADKYISHVPPFDGSGVKVAIIDVGFYLYDSLLSTVLPASVTAISFRSDNDITGGHEIHGTQCAEIVHDMAPGAQLYLLNVNTLVDLNNAVQYCINQKINIISQSLAWFNQSFYDGQGLMKPILDDAAAAGILWCTGSGNFAFDHWDDTFNDPDHNGWENFTDADEDINIFMDANAPQEIYLAWNEWPVAKSDYNMYLYRDDGLMQTQVAESEIVQNGTQPPIEKIEYTPTEAKLHHLKIKKISGDTSHMALFIYGNNDFKEHYVAAHSLADPAPIASSFSVGASDVSNDVIEDFSSQGPTIDGRRKPDICGPDGTTSVVDHGYPFWGTSASCPHVAGAAALLLTQDPTRTVEQLKTLLMQSAVDLGDPGYDYLYGAGRLRMPSLSPVKDVQVLPSSQIISLFPNPVTVGDQLVVGTPVTTGVGAVITISDVLGRTVMQRPVAQHDRNVTVPVGELFRAGVYVCRIVEEGKTVSSMFTVRR